MVTSKKILKKHFNAALFLGVAQTPIFEICHHWNNKYKFGSQLYLSKLTMMGLIVNFGVAPRLLTHNIGAVVKGDTIPLVWVCWVLEWEGAGPPRVWWVTPSHAGVVSPGTGLVVHKVECFISFPNFGLHKIFYLFHGHIGRGQFIINVFLVSILYTHTHRGILKWGEFGLAVFLHFPSLQKLLCWNNHNVQKTKKI